MSRSQGSREVPVFEFHIAGRIRQKLQVDETLFATNGQVVFADFHAVRQLAYRMNETRAPQQHIYPGELNAAGLLDEVYHLLLREYEKQLNPKVFQHAEAWLTQQLGGERLRRLMLDFTLEFPPLELYRGRMTATGWLSGQAGDRTHTSIAIEEILMLLLANLNPATKRFRDLFDRGYLENQTALDELMAGLEAFFAKEPPFGPEKQDIITLLKAPMLAAPEDLNAQLDYVMKRWKAFLPEDFVIRILKGKDLMKEDMRLEGGEGDTPTFVPFYKGQQGAGASFLGKSGFDYVQDSDKDYDENEAFTQDTHWMPRVVLMAKNTWVWLDQLSKKYQRDIRRLDQIPDEELDQLARWNFNGLWLIGIWERSNASRRIKHIMGFTDAVSSAYSLYDYQIAHDLGGEEAYQILNERARARGIRLASDMVPNHTGIYSKWVIENPDYFIQTRVPPFPAYRFTGENLSEHPDIEVRIDDGYFSKTDAAVVFQRIDKRNGDVRYIYHGNDGTNMPWNDTAQLDMIKQEVREAVIQMIFEVARRFSIIRFDAAMTLAKKHFARLWYPRPGTGGDIPSRADYAMSQAQFDALFPVEFWREVVDRMNETMPETLLLAEAFWFMEGYFVRTLGMHRVYNSAFMHMLKNEENEKYRDLITNTLEFEPEILKRYVNFMSNPDEETAIRQFGTGDKYFGVCVLMSTLPGLPMFAHGQLEGYTEKYGMEYQRAYYNELPQQWLVEKHQKEIFPLLKKRYLFSDVEHFNFYDFQDDAGYLNENVMAYTNRFGHERVLVLFNNKYEGASGRISHSAPKLRKGGDAGQTRVLQLGEALGLNGSHGFFYVMKEHISGLEYLKSGKEIFEQGLHWHLNGFEYRIFWEFLEIFDATGVYERLHYNLAGQGVVSIEQARKELELEQVYAAFEPLFQADVIDPFIQSLLEPEIPLKNDPSLAPITGRYQVFAGRVVSQFGIQTDPESATKAFFQNLQGVKAAYRFVKDHETVLADKLFSRKPAEADRVPLPGALGPFRESAMLIIAFYAKEALKTLTDGKQKEKALQDALMLRLPLQKVLRSTGRGLDEIERDVDLLDLLLETGFKAFDMRDALLGGILPKEPTMKVPEVFQEKLRLVALLLDDPKVKRYIGANFYEGTWFFSKEKFEELLTWLFSAATFEYFSEAREQNVFLSAGEKAKLVKSDLSLLETIMDLSDRAGYQLDLLKKALKGAED
ncbi:MAG: alpha-amylase family glycosyl hydrolase [Bacteroides sp.]|jgi:glycosidase|nr:alpha-amylase family glycosyl hydrolase [Bacteroides sp.]